MIRPTGHGDGTIEHCQEWIAHHYAEPNPVRGMQERSGLPERTFKRRFRAATGYTPIEYVQTLRIEEAKHELETGDAPVDDGRWGCVFTISSSLESAAGTMRRHSHSRTNRIDQAPAIPVSAGRD